VNFDIRAVFSGQPPNGRFTATNANLQLQAERTGQIVANQHSVSWSTPKKDGAAHLFGTESTAVFYRGCR